MVTVYAEFLDITGAVPNGHESQMVDQNLDPQDHDNLSVPSTRTAARPRTFRRSGTRPQLAGSLHCPRYHRWGISPP